MKRLAIIFSLVATAWMLTPAPQAEAWSWSNQRSHKTHKAKKAKGNRTSKAVVPELDPSAAGAAIVLMLGGAAYITSRRREKELV